MSDNYLTSVEKKTLMHWYLPVNEEKLCQAQEEWDTKFPCTVNENGKHMNKEEFVVMVNIHIGTHKNYIYGDEKKRRKPGHSVGCYRLVTVKESAALADIMMFYDRRNEGKLQA